MHHPPANRTLHSPPASSSSSGNESGEQGVSKRKIAAKSTGVGTDIEPGSPPSKRRRSSLPATKEEPVLRVRSASAGEVDMAGASGSREDVKDGDSLALKRLRNTEAARRSRAKKMAKMDMLEVAVDRLEAENSRLVVQLAVVESEKTSWIAKQEEYVARIARLEQQLSESHQAIISQGSTDAAPDSVDAVSKT
ncbi:hypothetical protein HDU97_002970 [Phlyctochytrium planicorne]|nr:hypothetical protein HDU97_002970 [Phlyctochytrium planicorne]